MRPVQHTLNHARLLAGAHDQQQRTQILGALLEYLGPGNVPPHDPDRNGRRAAHFGPDPDPDDLVDAIANACHALHRAGYDWPGVLRALDRAADHFHHEATLPR